MNTITQTQTAQTIAAPQSTVEDNTAKLSSDFNTFLKMLTVQAENQDPLNPMDTSEFSTQLATFSAVEQQTLTNTLLREMQTALGGSSLLQHVSLLGRDVLVEGPVVYEGSPLTVRLDPPQNAVRNDMVIENTLGQEIGRRSVSNTETELIWTGLLSDGSQAENGAYRFQLESHDADGTLTRHGVQAMTSVSEMRNGSTGLEIVLLGGRLVSEAEILAIR